MNTDKKKCTMTALEYCTGMTNLLHKMLGVWGQGKEEDITLVGFYLAACRVCVSKNILNKFNIKS